MIIFTEHNEVVMSVDDMRTIIRHLFDRGWETRDEHPEIPKTFAGEHDLKIFEDGIRQGKPLRPRGD
jgi:hypothetical protein